MPRHRHEIEGLSIFEVAIIVVALGLILGVLYVGGAMVRSSSIRSVITDLQRVNTDATSFQTQYGGLPGDLSAEKAVRFGFLQGPSASVPGRPSDMMHPGRGDDNGLLEGCSANAPLLGCETALFWVDLRKAALILQPLDGYDGAHLYAGDTGTSPLIEHYLYRTKLRATALLMPFPAGGLNYFALAGMHVKSGVVTLSVNGGDAALTPYEAWAIDEKLDDGAPASGRILSIADLSLTPAPPAAHGVTCVSATLTGSATSYQPGDDGTPTCALAIRAGF